MTTIENLLVRKRELIQKKKEATSDEDRDEIERQIMQVDIALSLLDRPPSEP